MSEMYGRIVGKLSGSNKHPLLLSRRITVLIWAPLVNWAAFMLYAVKVRETRWSFEPKLLKKPSVWVVSLLCALVDQTLRESRKQAVARQDAFLYEGVEQVSSIKA
jgi:hypothetical protein